MTVEKKLKKTKMTKEMMEQPMKHGWILTVIFGLMSIVWMAPLLIVLMNSFKDKSAINLTPFTLPSDSTFVRLANYVRGLGQVDFVAAITNSLVITVLSVLLIIFCTSMCGWYIARVNSLFTKVLYLLFAFSMLVPFQMVMYPLSKVANMMHITTPWTIPVIYLGFGAGLAVFMFTGFAKSIPVEIEEAAMIDGCNALQIFFKVVLPIMKPTYITVAILQSMWVWNDYLLPYLVLDIKRYKTLPIAIQYMKGGYGSVDWGGMMAMLIVAIIPIVIFYMICQKHIIKGVVAGAVKG